MTRAMGLPIAAERLIPHRPPMQLIEALAAFSGAAGTVNAWVTPESPLLAQDGALVEVALLELLAQAYAAVQGYADRLSGKPVQKGFLVGVRKVAFLARPRVGDRLEVRVRTTTRLDGFAVVEGSVCCGEELLAQGSIKLWIVPGNEHETV